MPEGPEIRRAADRLAAAIVGNVAEEVFFAFDALQPQIEHLRGRRVMAIDTWGKAMLTRFAGGRVVYSHNQLYGRWYVRRRGTLPRTGRSLRFAVHTATHSALLYSASEIEVLRTRSLRRHPYLSRLGPDPLHAAVSDADVMSQLVDDRFSGRQLAALYLDQSFVAGIGNYLRSEILFTAGIHPGRRPRDCTLDELEQLAHWTVEIVRQAYATAGLTGDPDRMAAMKARGVRRSRYRHAAFAREGKPCYGCGAAIEKAIMAGRRCYLCLRCQPPTGTSLDMRYD